MHSIAFEEIHPRYNVPVCYVMLKEYGKTVLDLVSLKCKERDDVSISGHSKKNWRAVNIWNIFLTKLELLEWHAEWSGDDIHTRPP